MTATVVFAGGGTGGHLFPAVAIAEALAERAPGTRSHWLVSDRPLDADLLTRLGRPFTVTPARPLALRPVGIVRLAVSWGACVRLGRSALRDAGSRGPVTLVAMGGFVCPPAVRAAAAERVRLTLVNLDAVPGLANRYAARRATRVLTAVPVPARAWEVVGPIVRRAALPPDSPARCRSRLGLDPDRPTLFVSGGSQGARSINAMMAALVPAHASAFASWQVVHQTGADADPAIASVYERAGVRALVTPFLDEVGLAWGAADLALGRAGAGTVAEAWATRTPTAFMPYPHHADEHQRRNAAALVDAGAALVLTDHVDPARNLAEHARALTDFLADEGRRARMRAALAALGPADGAARAADAILATLDHPARPR